jgi:diguanylate cyclase (GGDEF)-like protein
MAAPVRERGRVVGTLVVATRRPGRRYSEAEGEALTAFASHAGLALNDARLAGEVERATHDPLTGLPNRAFLGEHLHSSLSARPVPPAAVVALDLDAFKNVNDRFGHSVGDELLVQVATRLLELAGPSDLVARLAGEEFALLPQDPETAEELASEVCEAIARPFLIGGREVRIEASAGLARGAGDAEELIRNAELARDRAKGGNGCVVVYEPRMRAELVDRLTLQDDLGKAIDRDELEVHYQPKVDATSRRVLGLEALVRWRHPERGLMPPVEFIGIAEEAGHIGALTQVVLEDAIGLISTWWENGHQLEVSVNLSTADLDDPTFAARVRELLEGRGLPGEALELEITESALMGDPGAARATFASLSTLGVGVSIDDFGTGYSSLERLKSLPINELKIDRSFVAKLDSDADDAAIVRTSIDLAHSLGVRVVAEGVETEVAMRMLAALGCDRAQGYLIAKPMPRPELDRWLRSQGLGTAGRSLSALAG